MKHLTDSDRKCLEAAEAWLHLGSHLEAEKELEAITLDMRDHPEVLGVRWEICAKGQNWQRALTIAETLVASRPKRIKCWVRKSHSLHKLGRQSEAGNILSTARQSKDWGPDDLYELASEAAEQGNLEEALECVRAGAGKKGFAQLKALALETPMFTKIRQRIRELGDKGGR
jgi:predicted Zn-dependent protease